MTHTKIVLFCLFAVLPGVFISNCLAQPINDLRASQLVLPEKNFDIKFEWKGDSVGTRWEPHAALLIPVTLPNCPKVFYMQFDTGSPFSLFYRNKLKAINRKYPLNTTAVDTVQKFLNYRFQVGRANLVAKEIALKDFGNDHINYARGSVEIIGTLGSDFIDGRTIIINYPKQKISFLYSDAAMVASRFELTDFVYARRSILFPAKLRKKHILLFYDTGSSAYELLTDKKTAETLSGPGSEVVKASSNSWGRTMTSNTVTTNDSIQIASGQFLIGQATYMEGVSDSQLTQMMKLGIGGMTGNKLFLNAVLLIDTKNKKFGLKMK